MEICLSNTGVYSSHLKEELTSLRCLFLTCIFLSESLEIWARAYPSTPVVTYFLSLSVFLLLYGLLNI